MRSLTNLKSLKNFYVFKAQKDQVSKSSKICMSSTSLSGSKSSMSPKSLKCSHKVLKIQTLECSKVSKRSKSAKFLNSPRSPKSLKCSHGSKNSCLEYSKPCEEFWKLNKFTNSKNFKNFQKYESWKSWKSLKSLKSFQSSENPHLGVFKNFLEVWMLKKKVKTF